MTLFLTFKVHHDQSTWWCPLVLTHKGLLPWTCHLYILLVTLVQGNPKKYGLVEDLDSFVQCHYQHMIKALLFAWLDCTPLKHLIIVCIEKFEEILTFKFVESISQPFNDALPIFISFLSFVNFSIIPFIIDAKSSFVLPSSPTTFSHWVRQRYHSFTHMHVKMRRTTGAWLRKKSLSNMSFVMTDDQPFPSLLVLRHALVVWENPFNE